MKKFILLDGNAIMHRAYHALPPLNSKDGQLANAVYGFFSMFLKIIADLKPEYTAVCFDRPKPTFRQSLYVGYQAQRPKMDNELVPQIGIIHKVLESANIPIFEVDGYEADDLIGTISVKTIEKDKDIMVIIVSGDRDLLQLVNHNVKVLAPITGITKMILFDAESVKQKYGLEPKQFIDYKALVGDPSDNYPGISGIGPKTAANLLNKYHNFENLYKNLDKIPQNLSIKLANDAEQAALAKKLATIVIDAPIKLKLDECLIEKINKNNLIKKFETLGFKSLLKRTEANFNTQNIRQEIPSSKQKNNQQLGLLD